jgi:hypothetical protein
MQSEDFARIEPAVGALRVKLAGVHQRGASACGHPDLPAAVCALPDVAGGVDRVITHCWADQPSSSLPLSSMLADLSPPDDLNEEHG